MCYRCEEKQQHKQQTREARAKGHLAPLKPLLLESEPKLPGSVGPKRTTLADWVSYVASVDRSESLWSHFLLKFFLFMPIRVL